MSFRKKMTILLSGCGCALAGFLAGVYVGNSPRGIPFTGSEEIWSIALYTGSSIHDLKPAPGQPVPVLDAGDVTDLDARFVADPFMIYYGTRWHMYFEVCRATQLKDHGEIGYAHSGDGLAWNYHSIVLDEPFHLSYPFVFTHGNELYMIPESNEAGHIRLYRAQGSPDRWKFDTVLVDGNYVDATLVFHNEKWYLFAGKTSCEDLYIFFADSLRGPYTPHPMNPVIFGNPNFSRPAGRIISSGDTLIRFAQDDYPYYGNSVWAMQITNLTPSAFTETMLSHTPLFTAAEKGWNARGMHHVDAHRLNATSWIACVDGKRKQRVFGFKY